MAEEECSLQRHVSQLRHCRVDILEPVHIHGPYGYHLQPLVVDAVRIDLCLLGRTIYSSGAPTDRVGDWYKKAVLGYKEENKKQ